MLADHDISALPVVNEDRHILGILSEADLLRREELGTEKVRPWWLEAVVPSSLLATDYSRSHRRKVRELMAESVVIARGDATLSEIAALLERQRIKRAHRRGRQAHWDRQPRQPDSSARMRGRTIRSGHPIGDLGSSGEAILDKVR